MLDTQKKAFNKWLLNNKQELLERAVNDIDTTNAFYKAVKLVENRRGQLVDGDVSRTQLSALLNMGRSQDLGSIRTFIKQRAERRRKVGKNDEADFWDQLFRTLKALKSEVVRAQEENGWDESVGRTEIEAAIVTAYLEHFVAHCRYRAHYIIEDEVQ